MMDWQTTEITNIIIKMVLALVCGGILGIERERKKRPAGFRTYMLVCLGSALVMMTNQYIYEIYQAGDPSRMAAQVISGMGFLGAGTIIVTRHNRVKGLTTAAGLWSSACVGLAIGIGFYEAAIIGAVMVFIAMVIMHGMERRINTSAKLCLLYIELKKMSVLRMVRTYFKEHDIEVMDMEIEKSGNIGEKGIAVLLSIKVSSKGMREELVTLIGAMEGVTFIEEL